MAAASKRPQFESFVRTLTGLRSGIAAAPPIVDVLAREPDLASGIAPDRMAAAHDACQARVERIARGPWDIGARHAEPDGFGLLLLSGFVVRRVGRGGRFGAELLGPGDLLRPWQTVGVVASRLFEPAFSAIAATEAALLDDSFARRAAPFPGVAVALVDRAMLRSRQLALTVAIVGQPRVDRRLHWLLWQLADRWGRTGREGVTVELPLTHALLSELVAARRPSVSTALASLVADRKVERDGQAWLLRGGPPADYVELATGS